MFICINKFMVGKMLAVDLYFSALVLSQFIFSCPVGMTKMLITDQAAGPNAALCRPILPLRI